MQRFSHLVRRLFESIRARPLNPTEQDRVSDWLSSVAGHPFWRMQVIDQRHALACADLVADREPQRVDLIQAALLHDIGKRHSHLGIVGRVFASALALMRLPTPNRLGNYLEHGSLGAADLAPLTVAPIVTAFASGHHGPCPAGLDRDDWALLREADGE